MTIKHGTHPADTDQRGKDSWRHWHEGHAERVLMEGPGQRVLWERTEAESDPVALARRYLEGADIVLVEGYKRAALPKIEVYRLAAGAEPLFDPAVPAGDVAAASPERKVVLAVIESVAAGQFPERPIGPGQATRIFTGAPLPAGADTVVRQEDTEGAGPDRVTVVAGRDAGKNVRHRGEDIRKGEIALSAGTPLGPAQLGVLASIAHGAPLVHRAPRVAFMGSGDEIVDLDRADEILAGRKIATSNSYTL